MKTSMATLALIACCMSSPLLAQGNSPADGSRADTALTAAFPHAAPDWLARLKGDQTMEMCSAHKDTVPRDVAREIEAREQAAIQYPADGRLMGDWKRGEQLAQSGYGLRFTDYPPAKENGGNCYACHQLTRAEVSYGTIGPSLLDYGKARGFTDVAAKVAYEKIYDSQATYACSLMPRFGVNHVLSSEQIKDIVALLMSPESPVNCPECPRK